MSIDSPNTEFTVVINPQEQYSIWPTYHPVPQGWKEVGARKGNTGRLAGRASPG